MCSEGMVGEVEGLCFVRRMRFRWVLISESNFVSLSIRRSTEGECVQVDSKDSFWVMQSSILSIGGEIEVRGRYLCSLLFLMACIVGRVFDILGIASLVFL